MKKLTNLNFGNYYKKIRSRRSFVCGIKGTKINKKEIKFLQKYKPWGVILFTRNIKTINQTKKLTNKIKKIFNDRYYPIMIDEEGGRVSRLKNIFDNSLFTAKYFGDLYLKDKDKFRIYIKVYIKQIAYLLNLMGINFNTVPVLDVYRVNYHKIIGDRSFSKNPKIVSKIGDFVIREFHKNQINTIIKHIPGHGLSKVDSHLKQPVIRKKISYLIKNDFIPFYNKKSYLAMTAHIIYKNIDKVNCATHSKKVINVIRNTIKFKNIIISDDISMKALKYTTYTNTKKAFHAGCNIVLHCNAKFSEMEVVAKNSPKLSKFIIKKTSQIIKNLG